jgi:hypothetical protein
MNCRWDPAPGASREPANSRSEDSDGALVGDLAETHTRHPQLPHLSAERLGTATPCPATAFASYAAPGLPLRDRVTDVAPDPDVRNLSPT